MISAYHRPPNIEQALALLSRTTRKTAVLGGGTQLTHQTDGMVEVVDIQLLGLNRIESAGGIVSVGAGVTLQSLAEATVCPAALGQAIKLEAPLNIRNSATVAGALACSDGRSAFSAVLIALDAQLELRRPEAHKIGIGDFLPMRPSNLERTLITSLQFPVAPKIAFELVSRTPADKPIAGVAMAKWASGRTRVAVCGFGTSASLAHDGSGTDGIAPAVRNAFHEAQDPWGSAEYRSEVGVILAQRCIETLSAG